jgi:thymidylate synthase (FAD)
MVLDHGYLKYIEHWGSDERIIEAARMSVDKGFLGWGREVCAWCGEPESEHTAVFVSQLTPTVQVIDPKGTKRDLCCDLAMTSQFYTPVIDEPGDEKLLRYLYTSNPKHSTPFEMAGAVFEIKAPIFVFREWHRHRTQSYNEMSARYTPLPNENYIPTVERLLMQGGRNKQAIGTGAELTESTAIAFQSGLIAMYAAQQRLYEDALNGGVPKELARIHLPVARYSRMRASANLLNWLKFLTLRCDSKAQWEIRQYADTLAAELRLLFPRTMGLFDEARGQ